MKYVVLIVLTIFVFFTSPLLAQTVQTIQAVDEVIDKNEGEAAEKKKIVPAFSFGPAALWLTRTINQEGRSNFVLRDFMPGFYFTTELQNLPIVTPMARVTIYYPLKSTFNRMEQILSSPLRLAADFILGAEFGFNWRFLRFAGGPGFHLFYMSSLRWHYVNLGAALFIGIEMELHPKWSLVIDGIASIDNGNFGTNKLMEPFNLVYQYQTSIGVKYSKKKLNENALVKPEPKPEKEKREKKEKRVKREEQEQEQQEDAPFVILER